MSSCGNAVAAVGEAVVHQRSSAELFQDSPAKSRLNSRSLWPR